MSNSPARFEDRIASKLRRFEDNVVAELIEMRTEISSLRALLADHMPALHDEVLTRAQTAQLLRVCEDTISTFVRKGLPCRRVGRDYRFLKSEVTRWVAAQERDDGRAAAGGQS
jgi:excisionase family DNA binding protein